MSRGKARGIVVLHDVGSELKRLAATLWSAVAGLGVEGIWIRKLGEVSKGCFEGAFVAVIHKGVLFKGGRPPELPDTVPLVLITGGGEERPGYLVPCDLYLPSAYIRYDRFGPWLKAWRDLSGGEFGTSHLAACRWVLEQGVEEAVKAASERFAALMEELMPFRVFALNESGKVGRSAQPATPRGVAPATGGANGAAKRGEAGRGPYDKSVETAMTSLRGAAHKWFRAPQGLALDVFAQDERGAEFAFRQAWESYRASGMNPSKCGRSDGESPEVFRRALEEIDEAASVVSAYLGGAVTGKSDFERIRADLSHDRWRNKFLHSIAYSPEEVDKGGRLVKFREAREGDGERRTQLISAFRAWDSMKGDFTGLFKDPEAQFGFVPTGEFEMAGKMMKRAVEFIDIFGSLVSRWSFSDTQLAGFWGTADDVSNILTALGQERNCYFLDVVERNV
jgi:hypothetical protein